VSITDDVRADRQRVLEEEHPDTRATRRDLGRIINLQGHTPG
jgi:hypothetical protein